MPWNLYKINLGDTLSKIAQQNRISIYEIKKLNVLKNDKIVIGKMLKIPAVFSYQTISNLNSPAKDRRIHIVNQGKSYWIIARTYGLATK